jgi:hypothetical protein
LVLTILIIIHGEILDSIMVLDSTIGIPTPTLILLLTDMEMDIMAEVMPVYTAVPLLMLPITDQDQTELATIQVYTEAPLMETPTILAQALPLIMQYKEVERSAMVFKRSLMPELHKIQVLEHNR